MVENALVGSRMPHVTLTTSGGGTFSYTDIWQRQQLLLVHLPPGDRAALARFEAQLEAARQVLGDMETALVVTRDPASGFAAPVALVADRWGEVTHAADLNIEDDRVTPGPDTLLTWVEATLHRCPECEGEAR